MQDRRAPILVRLRNFVGDVVLSLPTLQRLDDAGHELTLVGKPWAIDLLAGHRWPVLPLARGTLGRARQWRECRRSALAIDPGFDRRINAIALPWSFGSALEMRLAGLVSLGHAHEGRGLLLTRRVAVQHQGHFADEFWRLGDALLGAAAAPPPSPRLVPSAAHQRIAHEALASHHVQGRYIVIAPFSSTAPHLNSRAWRAFPALAAHHLPQFGLPIVICPGPGEQDHALREYPGAIQLAGLGLGALAAVLQGAALVIAGDTGPGHMAGAVGAPTLSLLGVIDPERWAVRGPRVRVLRRAPQGPTIDEVLRAATEMLGADSAASVRPQAA